jgi:acetyltransferase-like isoleucine patch superfamily enzyme
MRRIISEFGLYICNRWVSCIPSHTLRLFFYRIFMKFSIGTNSSVFMDCVFDCKGGLKIGNNTVINGKSRLDNRGGITIGNNVSISQEVLILTADHDLDSPDFAGRNAPVIIEDYAWIGTRVIILPGCVIGKGAVIAAGALVTKSVEPFAVMAGVPAKLIKNRNQNIDYSFSYRRLFQ